MVAVCLCRAFYVVLSLIDQLLCQFSNANVLSSIDLIFYTIFLKNSGMFAFGSHIIRVILSLWSYMAFSPVRLPIRIAKRREVKIGACRPGEVEFVDGLKAGEFVIIHGTLRARPDQEVKIITVETGKEFLEQRLKQGVGGQVK